MATQAKQKQGHTQAAVNADRADRAEAALRAYAKAAGERFELQTPEEYLIDLLTDLRHYAAAVGDSVDWPTVVRLAGLKFAEESREEPEAEPVSHTPGPLLLVRRQAEIWLGDRIVALAVGDEKEADAMIFRSNAYGDLLQAAKCALADLEGLTFDLVDLESDEPAALTIRELRAAIAKAED